MSSSYNCENELRELAEALRKKAFDLETAADTLAILRDSDDMSEKIRTAKAWAKKWMKNS